MENIKNFDTKTIKLKNYDSIFFGTKFNRWYSDNYLFVSIFPHNIDLLHLNIRHIEMIPVLVALKKPRVFFIRNIEMIPIPNSLKNIASIFPLQSRFQTYFYF